MVAPFITVPPHLYVWGVGHRSLYDNTRCVGVHFVFILGCVDNNCNGEIGPLSLYDNTICAGVHFVFILGCVDNNCNGDIGPLTRRLAAQRSTCCRYVTLKVPYCTGATVFQNIYTILVSNPLDILIYFTREFQSFIFFTPE